MWDLGLWGNALLRDPKGSYPVFKQVSEKTNENSEWLGRPARIGPGTSRLPVRVQNRSATDGANEHKIHYDGHLCALCIHTPLIAESR